MSDCLFCKIISREIPSKIVYEDEQVFAFYDISPAAPVHILIIPKEHIASIAEIGETHRDLVGYIHLIAKKIAEQLSINKDGYRIINNCGDAGGQTVEHLHFHLLGGRQMKWPPG